LKEKGNCNYAHQLMHLIISWQWENFLHVIILIDNF
ncbi:hypothetical protein T06_8743, partial [Trichinella sp. T6]